MATRGTRRLLRFSLTLLGLATVLYALLRLIQHGKPIPQPGPDEFNAVTRKNDVPPPGEVEKAVVMAKTRGEDVEWAFDMKPDWTPYVYTDSDPPEPGYKLRPPKRRGREAMTYLTFIIDNYHALPNYTAFVHAGAVQWHNEDIGPYTSNILYNLRLDSVDRLGYVNLRCKLDPGCPVAVSPFNPTRQDVRGHDIRAYFVDVYMELFNVMPSQVPQRIGSPCCAQFAVSRKRILERPLSDYVRMRKWAMETTITDSFGVGWLFEKVWHVIFGMDSESCPDPAVCRCDLFGWCGPPSDTCAKDHVLPSVPYPPRRDDYGGKAANLEHDMLERQRQERFDTENG